MKPIKRNENEVACTTIQRLVLLKVFGITPDSDGLTEVSVMTENLTEEPMILVASAQESCPGLVPAGDKPVILLLDTDGHLYDVDDGPCLHIRHEGTRGCFKWAVDRSKDFVNWYHQAYIADMTDEEILEFYDTVVSKE